MSLAGRLSRIVSLEVEAWLIRLFVLASLISCVSVCVSLVEGVPAFLTRSVIDGNGKPHSIQNLAAGGLTVPQFGQTSKR